MTNNQSNPQIHNRNGFIQVVLTTFSASIVAIRNKNGKFEFQHDVIVTPQSVQTEDEAREFGLSEARQLWSESEGWSYRIVTKPSTFTFDIGTD